VHPRENLGVFHARITTRSLGATPLLVRDHY